MHDHFVVCGFGRIGSVVTRELLQESHDTVVIENNPELLYEEKFIAGIVDDHNSDGVNNFLDRIKDVKDKYRLTDKFLLIASFLRTEITEDIELFKSMKKERDNISHGKEFDEEALPVEDARKLASKYLKNHMLATENTNQ